MYIHLNFHILNLNNLNLSSVTSIYQRFASAAQNANNYIINASNWNLPGVTSSLDSGTTNDSDNYSEQLMTLIGVPEDTTDEELKAQYGISMDEYFNPNAETIKKVSDKLTASEGNKSK